jgi:hypothetical protein
LGTYTEKAAHARTNTHFITGTGINHNQVKLQPMHDELGSERASALPVFHAVTGSDTTGQTSGVGEKTRIQNIYESSTSYH